MLVMADMLLSGSPSSSHSVSADRRAASGSGDRPSRSPGPGWLPARAARCDGCLARFWVACTGSSWDPRSRSPRSDWGQAGREIRSSRACSSARTAWRSLGSSTSSVPDSHVAVFAARREGDLAAHDLGRWRSRSDGRPSPPPPRGRSRRREPHAWRTAPTDRALPGPWLPVRFQRCIPRSLCRIAPPSAPAGCVRRWCSRGHPEAFRLIEALSAARADTVTPRDCGSRAGWRSAYARRELEVGRARALLG